MTQIDTSNITYAQAKVKVKVKVRPSSWLFFDIMQTLANQPLFLSLSELWFNTVLACMPISCHIYQACKSAFIR